MNRQLAAPPNARLEHVAVGLAKCWRSAAMALARAPVAARRCCSCPVARAPGERRDKALQNCGPKVEACSGVHAQGMNIKLQSDFLLAELEEKGRLAYAEGKFSDVARILCPAPPLVFFFFLRHLHVELLHLGLQ